MSGKMLAREYSAMTGLKTIGATIVIVLANLFLPDVSGAEIGRVIKLRATLFYLALESDYPLGQDAVFLHRNGQELYRASRAFVSKAAIEGSAKLSDGRVLNVTGVVGGIQRWEFISAPYGMGASGCPLIPMRAVAVDPKKVPLRSILMIAETKGAPLPFGGVHDGIWYALDTGGAIQSDRIDLFVGAGKASMAPVYKFGIKHLQSLTVTIVGKATGCPML
jgi:3D (Asp-Asp-Asp) domain-containing protein